MADQSSSIDIKSLFKQFEELNNENQEEKRDSVEKINNFNCPNCNNNTLIEDGGVFVCTECGRENGIIISEKQEWRTFIDSNTQGDNSRCSVKANPYLSDSTAFETFSRSSNSFSRGGRLQNRMAGSDRAISDATKLIKECGDKLNIPGVLSDIACHLYVNLTKNEKIKRGPSRKGFMANCQFDLCKSNNITYISPEVLAKTYGISTKNFNEGRKMFNSLKYRKKISIVEDNDNLDNKFNIFSIKPVDPESIANNVCEKLSLEETDIGNIIFIIRATKSFGIITSKMPQSIAAGCIILYIKDKGDKSSKIIKSIVQFCNISETTALTTFNELKKNKDFIFPKSPDDLVNGLYGNCIPEKQISKIYTAPVSAMPPTVIINSGIKTIIPSRGRPKKIKN